jgi:hypothetical protein
MSVSSCHMVSRLPERPVGATYVVEGFGGEEGNFRVIARYIVLPGGHRINVPADLSSPLAPRAAAFRRRASTKKNVSPKPALQAAAKKSRRGEEPVNQPRVDGVAPGEAPQPLTLNHPALSPGCDKRPGFSLLWIALQGLRWSIPG